MTINCKKKILLFFLNVKTWNFCPDYHFTQTTNLRVPEIWCYISCWVKTIFPMDSSLLNQFSWWVTSGSSPIVDVISIPLSALVLTPINRTTNIACWPWNWCLLSQYQSRLQNLVCYLLRDQRNANKNRGYYPFRHLRGAGGSTGTLWNSDYNQAQRMTEPVILQVIWLFLVPYSGCWQREDSEAVIWMPAIPVPAKRQRYCRRYHHQPLQHPWSHGYQWRNHSGSGFCIRHGRAWSDTCVRCPGTHDNVCRVPDPEIIFLIHIFFWVISGIQSL